jgi:hypothetical protein
MRDSYHGDHLSSCALTVVTPRKRGYPEWELEVVEHAGE